MEHLTELQLNDYLDGLLTDPEQARFATHLNECVECKADVDALREIVVGVQALPPGVRPQRDLLPGIHAAIDAEQFVAPVSWRTRSLWSLRAPLAAAAVLLIVATAVITRTFDRGATSTASAPQPNGSS